MVRLRAVELVTIAAVLMTGPHLLAQSQLPASAPPTPRHTGIAAMIKDLGHDVTQLPSKENLWWTAGGGALALAAHPLDDYVRDHIGGNPTADAFFKPGQIIGLVVPVAGSVTTYAWGRITDEPRVSHIGMDLLESQAVALGLTQGLKYATQRERPDGSGGTSFPSGHASSTFAFATALERHLGWKYVVPAYIGASYVAASRLPANRHWLSDVVFGAAVGIISGRTVTRSEGNPYPITINAIPGGAVVTFAPTKYNR
jgi:membrane-associated phospholipid phosphatase